MINIDFAQALDNWFWGLLVVAFIVLILSFRSARSHTFARILLVLRLLVFLAAIVLLTQPSLTIRHVQNQPRHWNLYLDNSLSMNYHKNYSLAALNNGINEISQEFDRRNIDFNTFLFTNEVIESEAETGIDCDGVATDLGKVLTHINELDPNLNSGVVIISDGQPTLGIDPVQISENLQIPVFTIGVGDSTPLVDLAIQSIDVPTVAIKGEDLTLTTVISSIGLVQDRINIILLADREPVGSRTLTIYGEGSEQEIRFQFVPGKLGKNSFEIVTSSLEDEINIANNRLKFDVTVLKDRYQVAVITGRPNSNTPVLKQYLKRQSRVMLSHYIQIGNRYRPPLKEFWESKYDLIIFDNFPAEPLSVQWQRIFARKLISQQSSLAWIVGPDVSNETARGLYPFFHVQPHGDVIDSEKAYTWYFTDDFSSTALGINMTGNMPGESQLPPIFPGIQVESDQSGLETYAYQSGPVPLPLLLFGEVEGLRSLVWTSNEFSQIHYKLGGSKYSSSISQMWEGMIEWLLRSSGAEKLYFRLNKSSYQQGEAIVVTGNSAILSNDNPSDAKAFMRVYQNGERISSTELGYDSKNNRWAGELWASKPGNYDYEITVDTGTALNSQTGDFTVTEGQIELNKVFVNNRSLEAVAQNTQAKYFPWNLRFGLFDNLVKEESVSVKKQSIHFDDEYLVLVLLLALLVLEWIIRRRYGLQ